MFLNGRVLPRIFSVSCPDLYASELLCLYLCVSHSLGKLKTTSLPTLLLQQMGAGALCCWWYPDSCTLLPSWDTGAGIAGLDDGYAVILMLLCLTLHHLLPVRTFIRLCHEIWQHASSILLIYLFIFPSDDSEGLCLTAYCFWHHDMWMLTSAALCSIALSQQNVSANWFSVVAGKQKASQPPRFSLNKK